MNREQAINYLFSCGFTHEQVGEVVRALTYEPITKNDLGVDCISRDQALEAIDTWDKFGYSARYGLERLDKDDKGYVPYVRYEDIVNCIKNLPSVTPQEPTIKALGEELRKARKGIADEKVLIGYNMAVAICNKHLGESEAEE